MHNDLDVVEFEVGERYLRVIAGHARLLLQIVSVQVYQLLQQAKK